MYDYSEDIMFDPEGLYCNCGNIIINAESICESDLVQKSKEVHDILSSEGNDVLQCPHSGISISNLEKTFVSPGTGDSYFLGCSTCKMSFKMCVHDNHIFVCHSNGPKSNGNPLQNGRSLNCYYPLLLRPFIVTNDAEKNVQFPFPRIASDLPPSVKLYTLDDNIDLDEEISSLLERKNSSAGATGGSSIIGSFTRHWMVNS